MGLRSFWVCGGFWENIHGEDLLSCRHHNLGTSSVYLPVQNIGCRYEKPPAFQRKYQHIHYTSQWELGLECPHISLLFIENVG